VVSCHCTNKYSSPSSSLSWYQSNFCIMLSISFIFPHLHPSTCIHGYSQYQHQPLSKYQTRQGKLLIVAFLVPSTSQTPWSRRPYRRNVFLFGPVPSFYREGCSAHYQSEVHSLDQAWSDDLILAYLLTYWGCSCSCRRSHRISWCVVLSGANLCVTLQS